jgi:glycosyltransferase involved in cell wall biosynthesis
MKVLLLFNVMKLEDMIAKGNVWYVRHYESYFDKVEVAYLYGSYPEPVHRGRTRLVALGCTGRFWKSILLSPIRLLKHAKQVNATHYLTADIVFSWWTGLLLRWLRGAKIVLMPVCIPNEIYSLTGGSLSGLPLWIERRLLQLSYKTADRIIMGENSDVLLDWLRSEPGTRHKLQVVPATVEEFPPPEFYDGLLSGSRQAPEQGFMQVPRLLYVGRLHREKMVMGLIEMLFHLTRSGVLIELVIVGDGPERNAMEQRAHEFGVSKSIKWLGFVPSRDLANVYRCAAVFVSTITGTALREAGLCRLPIVAYEVDWVRRLLKHEETALLVPAGDGAALAAAVRRLLTDRRLREHIAENFSKEAQKRWDPCLIKFALRKTFEASTA